MAEFIPNPTLRERVDSALACLNMMDGSEAWAIVDRIFAEIYGAIKRDPRFGSVRHDEFDALTAAVRERLSEELDQLIGGLIAIDDVHLAIDRVIGGTE
jgi:hypothetical protein